MTKEESSDNVKFMTPRARIIVLGRVHIYYKSYGENALFLQNFSSLHPGIDQTNESVVMMTEEECTKIVNFMTRIQGRDKVSHYRENVFCYLLLHQYTAHWFAFGLSDDNASFLCHYYFLFAVDMQTWALLTRSGCRVSGTLVTVKACGPLG